MTGNFILSVAMMSKQGFISSLKDPSPDPELPDALQALWYDRQGEWERAHAIVQDAMAGDEAWVHAYLHRKEGDTWNSDYWYRQAGRKRPDSSLDDEWENITTQLFS